MKSTRTNVSINIQYEKIEDIEKVLYKILNELSGDVKFGSGETENVNFNFVRESFGVETLKTGQTILTYKSKI